MRTRIVVIGLAIGAVALGLWGMNAGRRAKSPAGAGRQAEAGAADDTLAGRLRAGRADALVELMRALPEDEASAKPIDPAKVPDRVACLAALRAGLSKQKPEARITAFGAVRRMLAEFSPEGAPTGWSALLTPGYEILASGLTDPAALVRASALDVVGGLWTWTPGCTMTPAEEATLGSWKEGFYALVSPRLGDPDPTVRVAAVRCLGALPLDEQAAPAVAYLHDPDFRVRLQVLTSFASRPTLMSEEAILPLLHDPLLDLQGVAERILKARGLPQELVGLGRLVSHPRAEMRLSAIPLLLKREDIDPTVWLLHLTNDPDPQVRLKAVESFAGRVTPEVRQRLREMIAADDSSDVRAAAEKLAPPTDTASLPPLPGTAKLTPNAN